MSRNGTGNYSVPNTFVPGAVITASDHNENWSDIAAEITNSVATDGQTTMTGPLKAASGTLGAPSHTFGADADTGRYRKSANVMADVVGGAEVVEYSSSGISVTGTVDATTVSQGGAPLNPPGIISAYAGASAPTGWLLCNGASVSRTTYADLYAAIGTTYGNDDAATFKVPDFGGRVPAGKEATATRLTTAGSGIDGATLGAAGGAESVIVAQANLPNVNFTVSIPSGQGAHNHTSPPTYAESGGLTNGSGSVTYSVGVLTTSTSTLPAMSGTAASGGSGTALNKAQPTIIVNFIIKT